MVNTRKKQYATEVRRRKIQAQNLNQIHAINSDSGPKKSETDEKIDKIYSDIKSIPNYSSKIVQFLRQNENYSIHRRIVKRIFPRRRIITQYPFQIFQADLIKYPRSDYTYANKGYRFILVIIECRYSLPSNAVPAAATHCPLAYLLPVPRRKRQHLCLLHSPPDHQLRWCS